VRWPLVLDGQTGTYLHIPDRRLGHRQDVEIGVSDTPLG
jgi:hypothetical protein